MFSFEIEGTKYELYTHSYLGFGGERARDSLSTNLISGAKDGQAISDPCLQSGYERDGNTSPAKDVYEGVKGSRLVKGSADGAGACLNAVKEIFPKPSSCPTSKAGLPTTFSCVQQPTFVSESKNFMIFENFFYVASALQTRPLNADPSSAKITFPLVTSAKQMQDASNSVCGKNWTYVNSHYPLDSQPKDNLKWCFMSAYTTAFITSGLGLSWEKPVTIQQNVDGADIEWALGAAYKEAAQLLKVTYLRPT
jgi:hypothetical protein